MNTENTNISLSQADELRKFKDLLDEGIISQEEFEKKKEQLLNEPLIKEPEDPFKLKCPGLFFFWLIVLIVGLVYITIKHFFKEILLMNLSSSNYNINK
ncbi:MAG: SHOCT domain-containing protein [Oscillospiraceae bacterium]|nr:SHOCT domain-containing protein [Oscillospiraceae bacterium]